MFPPDSNGLMFAQRRLCVCVCVCELSLAVMLALPPMVEARAMYFAVRVTRVQLSIPIGTLFSSPLPFYCLILYAK